MLRVPWRRTFAVAMMAGWAAAVHPEENVYLTDVPDYAWYGGCYGTACGNLIGFWDRHGFPDFYTGPTNGGLAPLDSFGLNQGIYALWTTRAGRDGRPLDQPGHEDNYFVQFESTADDPYRTAGRPEHPPECIGDFIGLSQKKWQNLGGECDGNIDGYTYVYWDRTGARRVNHRPGPEAGLPAIDLQSGLRDWTRHRGYAAETFTQLADLNPEVTEPGAGFTFDDLRAEIDAGYPFLVHLQDPGQPYRARGNMPRANPEIHAMLVYGYHVNSAGQRFARVRTSWATGFFEFREWTPANWTPSLGTFLPVRGVIGYRPLPQILEVIPQPLGLTIRWCGPDAEVHDTIEGIRRRAHWYVIERAEALDSAGFVPVTSPTTAREWTLTEPVFGTAFYRVSLVSPPEPGS